MHRIKKLLFTIMVTAMIAVICSCGSDKAASSQGLTDALEKKQQEVDTALKEMEEASEALDKAVEEKESR